MARPIGSKNKEGHKAGNPRRYKKRAKGFSIWLSEKEFEKIMKKIEEAEGRTRVEKFLNLLCIK